MRQSVRDSRILELSCILLKGKNNSFASYEFVPKFIWVLHNYSQRKNVFSDTGVGMLFDMFCLGVEWFLFFFSLQSWYPHWKVSTKNTARSQKWSPSIIFEPWRLAIGLLEAIRKHVIAQSRNQCCNIQNVLIKYLSKLAKPNVYICIADVLKCCWNYTIHID